MYLHFFKRIIDFIIAFFSLLIFFPLFLIIAILVRVNLGSPIIFKQKRPGKNCKIFTMYKFRTMTNKTDNCGNLLPDSDRLTKFGSFLRSSSLDELPELYNILIGDMSLVGPRPLLVDYLPLYNNYQIKRHDVKPGITGLAQVNGRNAISWDKKFSYDIEYVEKVSLILDLNIIFNTIIKICKKEGINETGEVTTSCFKGNGFKNE